MYSSHLAPFRSNPFSAFQNWRYSFKQNSDGFQKALEDLKTEDLWDPRIRLGKSENNNNISGNLSKCEKKIFQGVETPPLGNCLPAFAPVFAGLSKLMWYIKFIWVTYHAALMVFCFCFCFCFLVYFFFLFLGYIFPLLRHFLRVLRINLGRNRFLICITGIHISRDLAMYQYIYSKVNVHFLWENMHEVAWYDSINVQRLFVSHETRGLIYVTGLNNKHIEIGICKTKNCFHFLFFRMYVDCVHCFNCSAQKTKAGKPTQTTENDVFQRTDGQVRDRIQPHWIHHSLQALRIGGNTMPYRKPDQNLVPEPTS